MADQVNPTGNGSTGPPQLLMATAAAQVIQVSNRPARVADPQPSRAEKASDTAQVTNADLELINSQLREANSNLKFQIDQGSGITYFKVVDSAGKVIRQVPSEEILSMARKLRELSAHEEPSGVLMDKEG